MRARGEARPWREEAALRLTPDKAGTAIVAAAIAILTAAVFASGSGTVPAAGADSTLHAARYQTTWLISKDRHGKAPNGPSTHGVISGDSRTARMLAFQSKASDLVKGDRNGVSDVFLIRRAGGYSDNGEVWRPGKTQLISKGRDGHDANGPSFAPAVDGNLWEPPRCVAFLSDASNLVRGDTNHDTDAFLWRRGRLRRISYPSGHQAHEDVDSVAVAGDCSRTAFTVGGRLFARRSGNTQTLDGHGDPRDLSFGTGEHSDLVFGSRGRIFWSRDATDNPQHLVAHGRNPAFNTYKGEATVAYVKHRGGHLQIAYSVFGTGYDRCRLGYGEHVVTHGNDDARDPVIVNTGCYIGFETDASNLSTNANGSRTDENGVTDAYLYTRKRKLTLMESVTGQDKDPLPGGGANPSASYYANYFVFDSPAHGKRSGDHQIFMRYLGAK